jgi:hypothetical protein
MAVFKCINPKCERYHIIIPIAKVRYICTSDGIKCPQKECLGCGEIMEDISEFSGYPERGIPVGSSNPGIGRRI